MAACRWRSAALQSPGAGHGSEVPPEELLARIQDFIKELLSHIKDRSMLVISLDKFRMRRLHSSEDTNLGIFERCEAQEKLSLQTSGRRILAMLRVLQIVQSLLQQGKHASKRDLYYTDPDQATVNQALIDISVRLKCTRSSLHVVSVGKGLIMGSLRFKDADRTIDCSVCKSRGYPIPTDAKMRLANDGFCRKNNCIVLTILTHMYRGEGTPTWLRGARAMDDSVYERNKGWWSKLRAWTTISDPRNNYSTWMNMVLIQWLEERTARATKYDIGSFSIQWFGIWSTSEKKMKRHANLKDLIGLELTTAQTSWLEFKRVAEPMQLGWLKRIPNCPSNVNL
ncbi:hypothetical protein SELMODRAFT_424976 [Selaginella moellendorffii]|uniref:Spo11/DNA topoisomerase VI subunit A N-terminal domain-containing protein n=1 Tax=Selaginella moellendorffii TaxID=88036 RepID=D8SRM5_SELML|nr:hypothetical protein SELMODRAFT_424976 [Selaginella moellendorffii]